MEKMRNLIDYLNEQTRKYNRGVPDITDKEFDKLFAELEQLEKETGMVYSDSPTQNVGYKVLTGIPKINIAPVPMLSLKKVHSQNEINEFAGKEKIVRMIKCDGLSVRLTYKDGKLLTACSRGNGSIGNLITEHIKCFLNVPLTIPYSNTYIIDGEAIIKYKDFEIVSKQEDLKNPRNAAAGSLSTLELSVVKSRRLSFIAWDVIQGGSSNSFIENLNKAKDLGFEIVYYSETDDNTQILTKAAELSIPCDGVVWKFDNIEYGKSLGATSHHFNNAVAWKPGDEEYETTLLNIEWLVGRTGQVTPVAIFDPVNTGESVIEKASLHNLTVMKNLMGNPYVGQPIKVIKSNMIIPQVIEAVKVPDEDTSHNFLYIPKVCPVCGKPAIVKNDTESEFLICPNPECEGKFINKAVHFAGKKGLDIKGISKATLEKLMEWGWLNTISDIFKLQEHRNEWIKKPGFGIKSVDNILNAIESSRQCNLDKFIAALGIPIVGSSAAKDLAKTFGTWEAFIEAVDDDYAFYSLPNFGPEMHSAIMKFNFDEACDIATTYLSFNKSTESSATTGDNSLVGKTFVITGKTLIFKNRDELKAKVESLGGKVAGSVSGKTDYLINNNATSSSTKNLKAKQLGVTIITEEDFINQFGI